MFIPSLWGLQEWQSYNRGETIGLETNHECPDVEKKLKKCISDGWISQLGGSQLEEYRISNQAKLADNHYD